MSETLDAIFIGAGHNSLACACQLARKGWKVAVFEQASVPGGAVKTGAYTEEGFRHDWAAMNMSQFAGSAFHEENKDELARHGLSFVPTDKPFASIFPGGRWLGVTTDKRQTRDRIAAFSQADAEAWQGLIDDFPERSQAIFAVLGSPMTTRALAGLGWKLWRLLGAGGALDFLRFMAMSPRAWLDRTFEDDHVKAMLACWGMHLDFAPDVAGGALFPYLEGMGGQAQGMMLGKGGAETIVKAMVAMIEAHGGAVHCDAEVTNIESAGGRATGITLADGRFFAAGKAVIANVAPRALHRLMGEADDDRHARAMKEFQHAPGTMMIHLAMDDLPQWPDAALREFAYVNLAPSMNQMARTYAQAQAGLLPDEPVIICGQPTAADPSRAPQGKHTLWLQVRMVPGRIAGDAKGEIAATDWDAAAEPMAERALDILESYAPGTRDRIIARRVVSPLGLEADNPNLVGGDQVCGSHHIYQNFLFRPARGYADGSTPLRDLHHTGAAVWPGGGVGAGAGTMLANKLAKR